ncbi:LysR substrate-binding domain-containing protein [Tessaracoccus aquimaris]|uniref:LysR substrate-binding domain-containing protein n=1 Tax=Tessaracoccus aquimaris TaxID=1332264 RepID=UPI001314EF1E|nr:LysR substrate-binding domain-containing protein [Tessaracoccus aquimaris]
MTNCLRIGKVPGVTLTKWQRIWEERFPGIDLAVEEVTLEQQRGRVVDGSLDLCFARLPIGRDGLHAIPLYDEVPVVWMSKDHVLAELDEVSLDDLADENVIEDAEPASIDLATYSAAVLRVPMSVARSLSRRDMVYRNVTDAPPTTVALVWRVDDENPLIDEFIGIVRGRSVNSSRSEAERRTKEAPEPRKPPAQAGRTGGTRRGSRNGARRQRPTRR